MRRVGFGLLLAGLLVAGCQSPQRQATPNPTETRPGHEVALIFNPEPLAVAPGEMTRAAWPEAVGAGAGEEQTFYREHIMDRQGWPVSTHRDYSRRFESVRVGRR